MELDAEFQYMRDSGLPALMEALLTRVVEARSGDPLLHVLDATLPVRAQAIADTVKKITWPADAANDAECRMLGLFGFNVFDYTADDPHADRLLVFTEAIFEMSGATATLGCGVERLRLWLLAVRFQYTRNVPFHNFRHAFAVTQHCFSILRAVEGLQGRLDPLEVAALLVSCLCHDLGHPGLNNSYQKNAGTPLAVRYNDHSVLEQFHCSLTFETIRCPDLDILCALAPDKRKRFREICIALIMATDVSRHKQHFQQLSSTAAAKEAEAKEQGGQLSGMDLINWDDPAQRLNVLQNLMMMSDISNETRDFSLSQNWAPLVQEEFNLQGDREKKEGLPVLPMMDRDKAVTAKEQQGFIEFLCLPLYESNAKIFPQLQCLVGNLRGNKQKWQAKLEREQG
eukprot:TRINITY_DN66840_c0_g1_i1.p1 TRINITY_DN66840_c0_g1~~TRINITY_DN66840_c0_g1_i1.p1  ORF type:complete len:431 (+),score=152.30 TRINITY_DN66840_c0_g1_i1:99-1295(+)